jgi:tol-pal system protein YbgF
MRLIAAASFSLAMAVAAVPAVAQMSGPRGGPAAGEAPGGARLERLEQQITDLQGVVAAVESLAKSNAGGGSGYAAAAGGGASSDQVRQLSEQIADLTQRIERLEARLGEGGGGGGGGSSAPQPQRGGDLGYGASPAGGFEDKQQLPPLGGPPAPAYSPRQSAAAAPARSNSYDAAAAGAGAGAGAVAASTGGSPARALFDQGYGALNRREYSAAEGYFQQFLEQYPSDQLAGNAQYWLGETAFVSGEYKTAADRFLKTFTTYPTSERAPEALLKLAISLRRLGNTSDACATFSELTQRYPKASQSVMQRADAEKKRANCS